MSDSSILDDVCDVSGGADEGGGTAAADSGAQAAAGPTRALVMAVAIVLILIVVVSMMGPRGLGDKLAARGWVLYTREGCGYCTKQMKVLGGEYPKRVECSMAGKCVNAYCDAPPMTCGQITGYPTWVHAGTKAMKSGLQTRTSLERMCDTSS